MASFSFHVNKSKNRLPKHLELLTFISVSNRTNKQNVYGYAGNKKHFTIPSFVMSSGPTFLGKKYEGRPPRSNRLSEITAIVDTLKNQFKK